MDLHTVLLASRPGVPVHLVDPVGAVVNPNCVGPSIGLEQQDDRVGGDLGACRLEVDNQADPELVVDDLLVAAS